MMKDEVRMPVGTQSPDSLLASQLAEAVNAVAPQALTDGKVDLERLRQALGEHVETGRERYDLTWPGKAEAIKAAQRPSLGTLRPKAGEGINEESTGNLIIEGDNLEVLKLLQKAYLGKIKMIYIDPPYNTGNDFVYEDNFADPLAGYLEQTGQTVDGKRLSTNTETAGRYHSNWLSMMHPRLTLARNLLREDGVIFISIDDNEVGNLLLLTQLVFGEENLVSLMPWKSRTSSQNDIDLSIQHEYIVAFARNRRTKGRRLTASNKQEWFSDESFAVVPQDVKESRYENPDSDPRGAWKADPLDAPGIRPNLTFPITNPTTKMEHLPPEGRHWRTGPAEVQKLIDDGRVVFGKDGRGRPAMKTFLAEKAEFGEIRSAWLSSEVVGTISDGTKELQRIFGGVAPFDFPKPPKLIRWLIESSVLKSDPSALILDFFAGSGTTAQAVLEMNEEDGGNRKFILVQLPEVVDEDSAAAKAGFANIVEITKERVRRVIKKLDGGTKDVLGLDGTKNLDRGFKVYALDRSNFVPWDATAATDAASLEQQLELAVDNVVHGRSHADLLAEILLKTGFPLETPITKVTIAGTDVYQVADPGFLVCLAEKVDAPLIKAIAATKPHRVVILDAAFQGNDALKTNAVQAFKDQGVEMFRTA
jgi:adenine-specific DNA-methyltransferase